MDNDSVLKLQTGYTQEYEKVATSLQAMTGNEVAKEVEKNCLLYSDKPVSKVDYLEQFVTINKPPEAPVLLSDILKYKGKGFFGSGGQNQIQGNAMQIESALNGIEITPSQLPSNWFINANGYIAIRGQNDSKAQLVSRTSIKPYRKDKDFNKKIYLRAWQYNKELMRQRNPNPKVSTAQSKTISWLKSLKNKIKKPQSDQSRQFYTWILAGVQTTKFGMDKAKELIAKRQSQLQDVSRPEAQSKFKQINNKLYNDLTTVVNSDKFIVPNQYRGISDQEINDQR